METVQLQCGNCQQVMAIGVQHLGSQVQCPHCQAVVQTPSPAEPPAPLIGPAAPDARESIFAGTEVGEDVLGGSPAPRMDLPRDNVGHGGPVPKFSETATNHEKETAPAQAKDDDLTAFKRRPIHGTSVLPLIAMIFLVPYAICTTLFIIYLVTYQNRVHPLDMLPDPVPSKNKGGPRPITLQTIHNYPLASHQKTTIGNSIRIGDIEVTPIGVLLTSEGDLQLRLRARNDSTNLAFEPINDLYVRYRASREKEGDEAKPYTFLEAKNKTVDNLYGGYLEYRKKSQGKEETAANGLLGPQDEEVLTLTTAENYRLQVQSIMKSSDNFLWRVQVRRGFVKHHGKEIATTAVIGVEFTPSQIGRDKDKT